MTREEEVKDARLFDVRIVERNIKRGIVTRKEYDRFLKALADAADKVLAPANAEPETPSAEPASTPQG
jgi:hypothetical protein